MERGFDIPKILYLDENLRKLLLVDKDLIINMRKSFHMKFRFKGGILL